MPQRLNSFLATNRELRSWSRKAQQLAALQRQYQQIAPATLAAASQVIGFEQGILTLSAANGAVATKLRHLTPLFIGQFQEGGAEVTGILVKVQVTTTPPQHPKRPSLSPAGHQNLTELAATLPASPLRTALQRLARRRYSP